jgi:hypothetical protein
MPPLRPMPPIAIPPGDLVPFGARWLSLGGAISRSAPYTSSNLGELFDMAVGRAVAEMLGGIPVVVPKGGSLTPEYTDCVEVGPVRIVGGVRPQNFDAAYRPDGVRFAYDTKTLNDRDSVRKNWNNMVNDLATEATTVHIRFPHAVVAFLVAIPGPAFAPAQRISITGTLERMTGRVLVNGPAHMAEAIALERVMNIHSHVG